MRQAEERARQQEAATAHAARQVAALARQERKREREEAHQKYLQQEQQHLQQLYEAIPLQHLWRPRQPARPRRQRQRQRQPPQLCADDFLFDDSERIGGGNGYGPSGSKDGGGSGSGTPAAGASLAAEQEGGGAAQALVVADVAGTPAQGSAWQFVTPTRPAKRLRQLPRYAEQEGGWEAAADEASDEGEEEGGGDGEWQPEDETEEEEEEEEEEAEQQPPPPPRRQPPQQQRQPPQQQQQQLQQQYGAAGAAAAAASPQALPGARRKTVKWSDAEVEALRSGVVRHGSVAQWAVILGEDREGRQVFHNQRVGGDLKDKWRNMTRERAAPQQRPRGLRRETLPWSQAEEAELQRLVGVHRGGNWQRICDLGHQVFRNRRTNVDLQNKWRLLHARMARQ